MSENKAKIFMVDDDADLVMIVRSVFLTEGYEFDSANSAKEALEKLDDVNPDLMILDVMMEDMVAGFRVVNALRDFTANPKNKKYENMPILMLTSVQQRTKMKFSEDAGSQLLPIDAFVEKPVKPKDLLEKVAQLLKKQ